MKIAGVLLAGGASRRFGQEKAVAAYGGGRLMDAPFQALIGACDEVAISARAGSGAAAIAEQAGFEVLPDADGAAAGPLAGILAGMVWAAGKGAEVLVTAPCDAALLQVDSLDALVDAARTSGGLAVARSPSGLEPLLAAWPVRAALPMLRRALQDGAHPAVKAVIEAQPFVAVGGFDGANVNSPADLDRLVAVRAGAEPDEHARLFAFESDFVRMLRCIPMCVRFKLDRSGIKLSLRQWSRFTLSDREALRMLSCQSAPEVRAYRLKLSALILARSSEIPTELELSAEPAWASRDVPPEIYSFAKKRGVHKLSHDDWSQLTTLERYALVKLSRDKHENANFEPALREFGVLKHAANRGSQPT